MAISSYKEKYLKSSGAHCPFCQSGDITSGPIQADGPVAWAEVQCEDCGSGWQDVWALTDIAQARGRDGRGIEC